MFIYHVFIFVPLNIFSFSFLVFVSPSIQLLHDGVYLVCGAPYFDYLQA